MERASPGFSSTDSPGNSTASAPSCSSHLHHLPACAHSLLSLISFYFSIENCSLCRIEKSWQEGILPALIWGKIEGSALLSWRGEKGPSSVVNLPMSLNQQTFPPFYCIPGLSSHSSCVLSRSSV